MTGDEKMNAEKSLAEYLKLKRQGRVIVESDSDGGFLMMLPDGQIRWSLTKVGVEKIARKWFQDNLFDANIGIGEIIWK